MADPTHRDPTARGIDPDRRPTGVLAPPDPGAAVRALRATTAGESA
ncbi:hypothetical protein JK358_35580 [Nocardia sp. 2]|uniref:Uncharacterized protein n=1 Tax=Nocardia acididurans TaxID=2802282 RepID=A0ABS1MGS0_9NOCA|nr:hypothetical protein [Nocardia acididurans]MBL1079736.1 hypothetical protein [Nocardia acididurans]